jgi:hypothetical protein
MKRKWWLVPIVLALLPIANAQPVCSWYAANEIWTYNYPRPDQACRAHADRRPGYPPGTWVFHHLQYWSAYGAMCWMRYAPNPDPNYAPTNLYNVGVKNAPCTNIGECSIYPENTTTGCNGAAHQLATTMPAATDVRSTFHETLACGIRTACNARCQMDNCKWLDHVSPASTAAYLQNQVPYPQIIAQCNALPQRPPGRISFCAGLLANRNIRFDLTDALVAYGCGTEHDWNMIFDVNFSIASQCLPARTMPRTRLAMSYSMKAFRTLTRNTCIARRTAAGLDPFINNDLRGQSCTS